MFSFCKLIIIVVVKQGEWLDDSLPVYHLFIMDDLFLLLLLLLSKSTSVREVVVNEGVGDGDGDGDGGVDGDDDDEFMINGGEFGMIRVGVGVGDGWIESN